MDDASSKFKINLECKQTRERTHIEFLGKEQIFVLNLRLFQLLCVCQDMSRLI